MESYQALLTGIITHGMFKQHIGLLGRTWLSQEGILAISQLHILKEHIVQLVMLVVVRGLLLLQFQFC